jgi:hypothetical protein
LGDRVEKWNFHLEDLKLKIHEEEVREGFPWRRSTLGWSFAGPRECWSPEEELGEEGLLATVKERYEGEAMVQGFKYPWTRPAGQSMSPLDIVQVG